MIRFEPPIPVSCFGGGAARKNALMYAERDDGMVYIGHDRGFEWVFRSWVRPLAEVPV